MKLALSRPIRGSLVALAAIAMERGFWFVCRGLWKSEGYLDHFESVHEPLFLFATLCLGLAVVLGAAAVAVFFGLHWVAPAFGAAFAASPEPLITALSNG